MFKEWTSQERKYQRSSDGQTFSKIEISSWIDIEGTIQTPWMSRQRLENEHTVLTYIAERTTIPVPKPFQLRDVNGCLTMTTEWIDGKPFDELDAQLRSVSYLNNYVQTTVLPQLNALTSQTSGTREGVVLPPRRLFDKYRHRKWLPRTSEIEEYHFTHNDLCQHNFLCDEKTGEVKAVIDWEFAGFYPSFFEAPLWLVPYDEFEDDPEEIGQLLNFLESTT